MTRAAIAPAARPPAQAGPPALAALTAAALTTAGHQVTGPDHDGRLLIATRLADCVAIVTPAGHAELHWTPHAGRRADPHRTAGMAAALLDGRPCPRHPDAKTDSDITHLGIAGMDLRHGGYTVALTVHADDYYYDVTPELTITSPRAPGTVYITSYGALTWHRSHPGAPAAITAAITRALNATTPALTPAA